MEALLLDKNNENTLWYEATYKNMTVLEKLVLFQFYPPKTKFENKYVWKYAPMHMLFDVNQQDLRHKSRLVVGRHVLDPNKYTTY